MQGHTSCLSTLPARPARLIACTPRVSSPLPRRLRVPQPASIRGWGCIFPHLRGGAAGGGRGEGVAHGEDDVVYLARVARGPELRRERVEPHKVRRARRRRREKKLPRPPRPHRHPVTTGPRRLAAAPPHTHTLRPSAAPLPPPHPSLFAHSALPQAPSTLCSPSSPPPRSALPQAPSTREKGAPLPRPHLSPARPCRRTGCGCGCGPRPQHRRTQDRTQGRAQGRTLVPASAARPPRISRPPRRGAPRRSGSALRRFGSRARVSVQVARRRRAAVAGGGEADRACAAIDPRTCGRGRASSAAVVCVAGGHQDVRVPRRGRRRRSRR